MIHDTAGVFRKLRYEIKTQFDTLKEKPGENIREEVQRIVEQEVDKSNLLASFAGSTTVKSSFPPPRRSTNDETRTNYWQHADHSEPGRCFGIHHRNCELGLDVFSMIFWVFLTRRLALSTWNTLSGSSPKLAQGQTKKKSLSSSERYPSETESSLTGEDLPPVLTVVVNLPRDCRLKFQNTLLGSSLTSRPMALTSRRKTALVSEEILNFAMLTKPWSWTYRSLNC